MNNFPLLIPDRTKLIRAILKICQEPDAFLTLLSRSITEEYSKHSKDNFLQGHETLNLELPVDQES